jgi:hypothetical protein
LISWVDHCPLGLLDFALLRFFAILRPLSQRVSGETVP